MELYLGQVPDDVVWVVNVTDEFGSKHVWFLTAEAASQTFRDEERYLDFRNARAPITLTRWEIHLPKRGMQAEDVDIFIENVLNAEEHEARRRLDVHATKIKT